MTARYQTPEPTSAQERSIAARDGYLLVNTGRSIEDLGIEKAVEHLPAGHVCTIAATEIAMKYVKRPVPNAVLLGALCAETGVIGIDAVVEAIATKFPGPLGQANIIAAKAAYELAAQA